MGGEQERGVFTLGHGREIGVNVNGTLCKDAAMPSTTIEVRRSYRAEEEVAIIDAVHDALVAAFEIPPADNMSG